MDLRRIRTDRLEIAFESHGPAGGAPAILLHGFPYDVRAYDHVAPVLAAAGCHVIVPYLRGYGATRFLAPSTPRSGEQAALGQDLLRFMDALGVRRAALAGYDWGGRAACVVAALHPARVSGLVSCTGYNIQDIAAAAEPAPPEQEHRFWYQYYLHGARGRAGLQRNRRDFCRLLWRQWSPDWTFGDGEFARSAASFDNPDFVDVVVHSYRHRHGMAPGDPEVASIEAALARQPVIAVPTINLHGAADAVTPAMPDDPGAAKFVGPYARRLLPRIGHNLPQEAPTEFAAAVLSAMADAAA